MNNHQISAIIGYHRCGATNELISSIMGISPYYVSVIIREYFCADNSIDWVYFFGASGNDGKRFDRYYKADINGVRVEKHDSNRKTEYSIGNISKAKQKYKTEDELLQAVKK